MTRDIGKDCDNRGEEAGRLGERYEVSKVVPPGAEGEGVYMEVLLSEIPIENEFEVPVGRMVKGRLVADATLWTVLPEGETKVVF